MSDFGNKISELNSLTSGNMAGELPLSLTLSSGTLATNKITLSQVRDLFDFDHAFETVEEGIAATVENQMFYVYVDNNKLSVNEYIRTSIGANAVIGKSGTKKIIYIPALLKHVKVQVESFAALREFKPWWDGQVVYLKGYEEEDVTGSGEFVGYMGAAVDDGGVIAAGAGFYWERICNQVDLAFYNVKTVTEDQAKAGDSTDQADAVQNAINAAIRLDIPLISNLPRNWGPVPTSATRRGIFVKKGINIAYLKTLIGNLILYVKQSDFTPLFDKGTNTNWILLNCNTIFDETGKKRYSTSNGQQSLGYIYTKNVDGRANSTVELNGQLHITSNSNITDGLGAEGLYGCGLWIADSYDNNITNLMVRECGSPSAWALRHQSYPASSNRSDEPNSNTISNILVHDCYDRLMCITGTKMSIARIHQEACYVTSLVHGTPTSPSQDPTITGYGYYNNYIQLPGGIITEFNGNNTYTAKNIGPIVTLHRGVSSAYGTWTSDYCDVFSKSFNVDMVATEIGLLSTGELKLLENVHISIGEVEVIGHDASGTVVNVGDVNISSASTSIQKIRAKGSLTITTGTGQYGNVSTVGNLSVSNSASVFGTVTVGGDIVDTTRSNYQSLRVQGNVVVSAPTIGYLNAVGTVTITGEADIAWGYSTSTWTISAHCKIRGGSTGDIIASKPFTLTDTIANSLNFIGTSEDQRFGVIQGVQFNGALSFRDYAKFTVTGVTVIGQLTIIGDGLKIHIDGISFYIGSIGVTTGYFTMSNAIMISGGSISRWGLTGNKPPSYGAQVIKPDTGEVYFYTATGWKAIAFATT